MPINGNQPVNQEVPADMSESELEDFGVGEEPRIFIPYLPPNRAHFAYTSTEDYSVDSNARIFLEEMDSFVQCEA